MKILFSHPLLHGKTTAQQSGFSRPCSRTAGFTLIEMIVTVTIAAILASIAVPSFTKMIERNRISTGTNEFLSALILARSEAVKRGVSVAICTSGDQTNCSSSGSTEFADGWMVFTDCDGDGKHAAGAPACPDNDGDGNPDQEVLIKVHGSLPRLSIVSATANTKAIRYEPTGRSTAMKIVIGKDSSTPAKQISISRTGRVRSCDYNSSGGC